MPALGVNTTYLTRIVGYEQVQLQTMQLSTLPAEIKHLEEAIAALCRMQGEQSAHPSLSLSLPATAELLSVRDAELDQLDHQIRSLQSAVPKKHRELERLENELRPLEVQKATAVLTAKEAIRRKEEGEKGLGDDLEMKGRWYGGANACLSEVLAMSS